MPMSRSTKRVAALVAAIMAGGGLAACSSGSNSPSGAAAANPTSTAAPPPTSGTSTPPQSGGPLTAVAATGTDHMDPARAYYTADYELERVSPRQLVAYPTVPYTSTSGDAWQQDVTP